MEAEVRLLTDVWAKLTLVALVGIKLSFYSSGGICDRCKLVTLSPVLKPFNLSLNVRGWLGLFIDVGFYVYDG